MTFQPLFAALALAAAAVLPGQVSASTITVPSSGTGSILMAANGLFIDDYDFSPASFAGQVSVTLSSVTGPVNFFTAAFFPDTAAEIDFSNLTDTIGASFSFMANVTATMPLTLRVFGAVVDTDGNLGGAGSYRVTVRESAVTAIPEPETYALLALGLGALGLATRRARRQS